MRKKLFTLLFAVVANIGMMFAWDYERVQIKDLYYNLDTTKHTAEVTSQNSTSPYWSTSIVSAVIPATVAYNNISYNVTGIGNRAFSGCRGLTSVNIPNSVTSIGNSAFFYCTGLTSCVIPNSVTSIGNDVLEGCYNLTSPVFNAHVFAYMPRYYSGEYTIPDGIEIIAGEAFYYCTHLTSVVIPNSVTSIALCAFQSCTALTSVTIGNSVTSIGNSAFFGCTGLTSVTIPNSVTSIGDRAFCNCSGLTSVTIGNNVTIIGYGAFNGCGGLTSPVFNAHVFAYMPTSYSGAYMILDGIESIAGGAFSSCSGLTSVTIPNSVTSIGDRAFYKCSGFTSVTIPNSVTSIGYQAFYGCASLTFVTIPNSVTSIGNSVFTNTGLTSPVYNTHVFAYMPTSYSGAYTIPDSIEVIAGYSFWRCTGLTSVTIPNSVTSIENYAFQYCRGLTSITIEVETPPALGYDVFGSTNNTPIYIPCGTLDVYKSAWQEYSSQVMYRPLEYSITGKVNVENAGIVDIPQGNACGIVITATPNYGYHFVNWSDGNVENPRTLQLTQDTTIIAEFAKNLYSITTVSANPECGKTEGDTAALYLDEIVISATPNYGYQFTQWSDGLKDNPRTVVLAQDTTFTAEFEPILCTITLTANDSLMGNVLGSGVYTYGSEVSINAIPNTGFHFVFWSDKDTIAARTFVIQADMSLTAYFETLKYMVVVYTNDSSLGNVYGGGEYAYNSSASLLAVPNANCEFVTWDNGVKDNPYVLAVTDNITIQAIFREVSEDIDNISSGCIVPRKIMIDNNVYIIRGDKTYTLTGQEVK